MNADSFFFPASPLSCGNHPADDDAVRAMLIEVAAGLTPPVEDPPTNGDVVRVICGAARRFVQEGSAFGNALRATLCAPVHLRNHLAISTNRCSALFRMSAWKDLTAEMNRLYRLPQVRPERDARLQLLAARFGNGWQMEDWTRCPPLFSQPVTTPLAEWFCTPFAKGAGGEVNSAYLAYMARLGPLAPGPDKLADIRLAAIQSDRDLFLWRADGQARDVLNQPDRHDARTRRQAAAMVAYFDQTVADLVSCDLSALTEALEHGRNAIVLRVHSGVRLIEQALAKAGVPIWNVVTHEVTKPGASTLLVAPGTGMNLGFVKLAKELKRRPQIVVIFPDGAAGNDLRLAQIGPAQARIRLGGAALARVAKSTLFFTRSVWTGQGFDMELIKGPEIDPGMSAETVNDLFVAFYADGLRRVIGGAVVDYGSMSFSTCLADPDPASEEEIA